MKKRILKFSLYVVAFLLIALTAFLLLIQIEEPKPKNLSYLNYQREKLDTNYYKLDNSWLRKSKSGLWEMYLEGSPFEQGVKNGKLSKELVVIQEEAFVDEIKKIIPSEFYLNFLKYFIAWFNRKLPEHILTEYQFEIYGISHSFSDTYDFIAPKYHRILNYHAAHDIGHALQEMNMVGCTSFSLWNNRTTDSSLIVGRNFDFYVGDKFAENKIVCFVKPDSGYRFMYITWGGMIGVVSGMNETGLTVTINAGKSEVPSQAATPISLLAREILQYASTIDEAYNIAQKRKTFVSESIMIGSKKDNQTAIIEKTPEKIGIKYSNENQIICSNHFQSSTFNDDALNIANINESDSPYRYKRVEQLLKTNSHFSVEKAAQVLRDKQGVDNTNIGLGNQKAINLLNAHHSVIFNVHKGLVWISTSPWQVGEYVCYDFKKVFSEQRDFNSNNELIIDSLTIPVDSFLFTENYKRFIEFKKEKNEILTLLKNDKPLEITTQRIENFVKLNPNYFYTWQLVGDYYTAIGNFELAKTAYKTALEKETSSLNEQLAIEKKLKNL